MNFFTRRFLSKRKLREKFMFGDRDEFLESPPRIQSNEHFEGVVKGIHKHRQNSHLCDVDIRLADRTLSAHRAILGAQSEFFDRLFQEGTSTGSKEELNLTGTVQSYDTLVTLVDYMYTGTIEISMATLSDVLRGATAFKLEDARAHCCQFMVENMSPIDCLHFWELSETNGLDTMATICKDITKCRFLDFIQYRDEVLDTPGWFMKKILEEGILEALYTEEILELLLRWMEKSPETRTQDCVVILQTSQIKARLVQNGMMDFSPLDKVRSRPDAVRVEINHRLKCLRPDQRKRMKLDFLEEDMESIIVSCVPTSPRIFHTTLMPYRRSEAQLHYVDIYVYRPSMNRWFVRSLEVPQGNDITSFVGCSESHFVFQAFRHKTIMEDEVDTQDIMLYNIITEEFSHPEDPILHIYRYLIRSFTSKHVRESYLATGKRLLCILGNYDKYASLKEWPRQVVMVYDFTNTTWIRVGELPKSQMQGLFSWIEHRGDVYVHNGENVKGIWFKISGFGSSITVTELAPPPTWFKVDPAGMEIQDDGNEIIVGRSDKKETEQFVYRISTNTWFTQHRGRIQVPRKLLPLRPVWEQREIIGANLSVNGSSDRSAGSVSYKLFFPCPYVGYFSSCVPPPSSSGTTRSSFKKKDKSKAVVWTDHASPMGEDLAALIPSKLTVHALSSLKGTGEGYRDLAEYRGYSRLCSSRLLSCSEFQAWEKRPPEPEPERPFNYFNADW